MRRAALVGLHSERGFTLIELLVSIVILSIIGVVLTGAVILGFRTTDGTAANVSRSTATRTAARYFTDDVQRADTVSTTDPDCATSLPGVLVHFRWVEGNTNRSVSYALDPPTGTDQELLRLACTEGGGTPSKTFLGHFTHDAAAPPPVAVLCDGAPCPSDPEAPAEITLQIRTDPSASPPPPSELTVRRRKA